MVKNLPANARDLGRSLGHEDPWSRKWQLTPVFLPGKIPWTVESGGLQSMGLQRSRHYLDIYDVPDIHDVQLFEKAFLFYFE